MAKFGCVFDKIPNTLIIAIDTLNDFGIVIISFYWSLFVKTKFFVFSFKWKCYYSVVIVSYELTTWKLTWTDFPDLICHREFLMAEIEYFVDPEKKSIDKFSKVADTRCMLLSKERQMNGEPAIAMTLKEAMDQVRIFLFDTFVYTFVFKEN